MTVELGQVIRRNRVRIIAILVVSTANLALVSTFLAWVALADANLDAWVHVLAGVAVATGIVAWKMSLTARRTADRLGAIPLHREDFPMVTNLLEGLAIAVGVPPVRAAFIRDDAPNAMAVGLSPRKTTIILTKGLLDKCSRSEVEAVLAVEMCSVRRFDTALQTVALACSSGVLGLHQFFREGWKDPRGWLLIAFTWPSMALGELLRTIELRRADFGADAMAVAITRHPEALSGALSRLEEDTSVVAVLDYATAPLWFEPVPHRDADRAHEFRKLALTASLADRRARLPHVRRS